MNKGITILILLVVLGAMALVFYSHTRQPARPETASADSARSGLAQPGDQPAGGPALSGSAPGGRTDGSPLRSPQDGGGLKQIDPPLSSGRPGTDGAPSPVRVTAGNTAVPAQPPLPPVTPPAAPGGSSVPPGASEPAAPGPDTAGREPAGRPSSGSPELTPWGTPSSTPAPGASAPGAPSSGKPAEATRPAGSGSREPAPPAAAVSPAKEPVLSDKGAHVLKDIGLHFAGQTMRLRIEADTPFPARTFVLNSPDRLVIDLPGVWKGVKAPSVPQNRLIKGVRVGAQTAGPRIVLDLSAAPKGHKVQRDGNVVEIVVQ